MLPLLSQLLERCGETTTSAQELSKLANEDVNLFFQQICSSTKSCFSGDDETDTLVCYNVVDRTFWFYLEWADFWNV